MSICLRVDLDYVPWDSSGDSSEPAMLLKLLDFARHTGIKFHFFISTRSLRAFPTIADAILGEGHDLDWLTERPTAQDIDQTLSLFSLAGHKILGLATNSSSLQPFVGALAWLRFITGPSELALDGVEFYPAYQYQPALELQPDHRSTLVIEPSMLAQTDPSLQSLDKFVEELAQRSISIRTIRDWLRV